MNLPPRLIADAMLGSLAKWLRIMGFDTLYFRDISDNELVRRARVDSRLLLTRDNGISRSARQGECLLIHSEKALEQVKEVISAIGIQDVNKLSPRCSICNGILRPCLRDEAFELVPEHVYRQQNSFVKCKECGKVYWDGSHKQIIDAAVRNIIKYRED
jgi:uncharacterized protein